jgi:hypothetical protein
MTLAGRIITGILWLSAPCAAVAAEGPSTNVPGECRTAAVDEGTRPALPNVTEALQKDKKLKVLAVGSHATSIQTPGGFYGGLERLIEGMISGVDVEIAYRGYSGELAESAAEMIRTEVALAPVDLVIFQVGTADGLARVPVEEFSATLRTTIAWLREQHVDLILISPRYARKVAHDRHYQAIRRAVTTIAKEHDIIRIRRYDAEEMFDRLKRAAGTPPTASDIAEGGYACLADYLGRAVGAALLMNRKQ